MRHVFEWIGRWLFGTIALGSGIFSLVREGVALYSGQHAEPRTAFERTMIIAFVGSAAAAWGQERRAVLQERRRYEAKCKGLPRLQVRKICVGSSSERVDSSPRFINLGDPTTYPNFTTLYTLSMKFVNNPVACTSESVGKSVSARLTFYDNATGKAEVFVDGRWPNIVERNDPRACDRLCLSYL